MYRKHIALLLAMALVLFMLAGSMPTRAASTADECQSCSCQTDGRSNVSQVVDLKGQHSYARWRAQALSSPEFRKLLHRMRRSEDSFNLDIPATEVIQMVVDSKDRIVVSIPVVFHGNSGKSAAATYVLEPSTKTAAAVVFIQESDGSGRIMNHLGESASLSMASSDVTVQSGTVCASCGYWCSIKCGVAAVLSCPVFCAGVCLGNPFCISCCGIGCGIVMVVACAGTCDEICCGEGATSCPVDCSCPCGCLPDGRCADCD